MFETYFKIFLRMGLKPVALRADTGAIGGDLSHEFHILTDVGESAIFYDKKLDEIYLDQFKLFDLNNENSLEFYDKIIAKNDFNNLKFDIKTIQEIYAMADDLHDEKNCPIPLQNIVSKRGIEVGQVFNFGLKYSQSMQATILGVNGEKIYPNMGSYGIGVSRVVAAAIEANHDERGIIWPSAISPFDVVLINIRVGDLNSDKICDQLYQKFQEKGIDALYDYTKKSLGQKFAIADLIGIPTQIIVGPKSLAEGYFEKKDRRTGKVEKINIGQI
jgi:prolyl-tRNA synthetase